MKKANRYEIRYYTDNRNYSKRLGLKGRLLTYYKAVRIMKHIKKSRPDLDWFLSNLVINI